jgi:hypothetical protein
MLYKVDDVIGRPSAPKIRPARKVIVLGTTDTQIKPNITLYARYTSAISGSPAMRKRQCRCSSRRLRRKSRRTAAPR